MQEYTPQRRAELAAIESANRSLLFNLESRGWGGVLPPPTFSLMMYLTTPFGRPDSELHEMWTRFTPAGLNASIWEQLPHYGDPDDPDTIETLRKWDAQMTRARETLPEYATALNIGRLETYWDLLQFAVAAGLVIHVADGLMLNPAPPRTAEVLSFPERVGREHRQLGFDRKS